MRYWLAFLVLVTANAQVSPAGTELLNQIRARVAENVLRLPNYTCTEKIERRVHAPRERRLRHSDTIRLNVAYVGGKELYGLPGTGRVDNADIVKLVRGTIGNGQFALYLKSIFVEQYASFSPARQTKLARKPAFRFDYQVPLARSGIHIRSAAGEAIAGYRGSLWVDRATLSLMRLIVSADNLPLSLGIASDITTIDYGPVSIAGQEFRLPLRSQYDVKDHFGAEERSVITFEKCREYVGESVLKFDATAQPEK